MGAAAECPGPPRLDAPPDRVVALDTGAAAIMLRLGLGERIVGVSGTDFSEDFTGGLRDRLDALPVLDDRVANRESVIDATPQLVTGTSIYEFGSFDGTASVQQLDEAGIASLVACDISPDAETTDIEDTYDYIADLAKVFDVESRGEALISELRSEAEAAVAEYAAEEPVRVMTLSAAPEGGQGINTSGGSGLTNGIITLAGGENIAGDVLSDFAQLSAEVVSNDDPEAIIVVSGLFPGDPADLLESIRDSPLLAGTTAIRDDRIVVVPQTRLSSPSLLNPRAIADIADGIHRE